MILNENIILQAKSITKQFPGIKALDEVNFELKKGEIHAIVGENGAGKSTFINIFGGILKPDRGEIYINGEQVKFKSPLDACLNGVGVVTQELHLLQNLSVAENIFANRQPTGKFNFVRWNKMYYDTKKLLKLFDEENINPKAPVKYLSIATQQVVEILKAISFNPKILILDEPTSSLTQHEVNKLFMNINNLKKKGISIIYISHNMGEVFTISDRITVLRDGRYIETKVTSETSEKEIVKLMVGREINNMYGNRESKEIGRSYFKVEGFSLKKKFENINFHVRRGEIVGIFGLIGAGRTELARSIFGAEVPDHGKIYLDNKYINIRSESQAIKSGIAYMTEDRKNLGLVLDMNIRENCILPSLSNFTSTFFGFLKSDKITKYTRELVKKFNIISPSIKKKLRLLSGGNQQKVLLSMWLGIQPKLLIVDEPTRGVDVGAKSEIYSILRGYVESKDLGILVISSDLPEILGICDRILVMKSGKLVGEFNKNDATEEKIIISATGV